MLRSNKLTPSDRIKVVVLILENYQGDILLTQRQKHQHLAGYWEFPGGKTEAGESNIQALKREIKEELNYNCTTTNQVLELNHDYPTVNVKLLVFHEVSENPYVIPAEGQSIKWVKKNQIAQYQLPQANQPILQYLLRNHNQT